MFRQMFSKLMLRLSTLLFLLIPAGFLWVMLVSHSTRVGTSLRTAGKNEHLKRNTSRQDDLNWEFSLAKSPFRDAVITRGKTTGFETRNSDFIQSCNKRYDVSFLKVHKAGSTTVMNIFLRFAIQNKLNIVLPRKTEGFAFNYLGYGKTASRSQIIPIPANETYNILCNHVVYDKTAFRSIMPADTVYVGIIRDPVSHFKSAASYYGFYKNLRDISRGKVQNQNVVKNFLKTPREYRLSTYFVYNRMSFDFGIPKDKFHDDKFVDAYIEELEKDYGVVLILEHFQESLVLMKRILCWGMKDILYVPLNVMHNKPDFVLDKEDVENLRKWNKADFKMYEHFMEVFRKKLEAFGNDILEEIEVFKTIQEKVKSFCDESLKSFDINPVYTIPKTKWDESVTVSVDDCQLMMESAIPMIKRLIKDAWRKYNESQN